MSDTSEQDQDGRAASLVDALRLAMVPGVGPRIRQTLLERFDSPAGVFDAAPSDLRSVQGVGPKLMKAICEAKNELDVDAEIDRCRENDVEILLDTDPHYPPLLQELPDPPGVLFLRGSLAPQDAMSIAIVGTRHATPYGLRTAERLGASLARAGLTIVSGLARGIDAAAHRGALAAGGRTLAVLGSGVLSIYPPEHKALAEEVTRQGAVMSESPPLATPRTGSFPQRNRIVSGLSLGAIIVEAGERSGASITARLATEQGRDVFAVPGRIDSRASKGCHRLLREGAILVESADDVLEALGPLFESAKGEDGRTVRHPAELTLNEVEQQVLDAIDLDGTLIDQIVVETGLPVPSVLSTVSVLEMRRLVRRVSGNRVARC